MISFRSEVPRGMSFIRYSDAVERHGDLIDEGQAIDGAKEAVMADRVETMASGEDGNKVAPPAGLGDS